jgi:hypothetical protein
MVTGPVDVVVKNTDLKSGTLTGGFSYIATSPWRVSTFGVDPSPNCDLWFFDFGGNGALFPNDMALAGLHTSGADPVTDGFAEDLLQAWILGYASVDMGRNFDGTKVSGSSFNICFVGHSPPAPWVPPPSAFGAAQPAQYNVMVFGGVDPFGVNLLGRALIDPTVDGAGMPVNGNRENNVRLLNCGVFTASAFLNFISLSMLNPVLGASDRPYVDGSYSLGQGTAAQDARFLAVRNRMNQFAQGAAQVAVHELSHSVGLVVTPRGTSSSHCSSPGFCIMRAPLLSGVTSHCLACTAELANALGQSP